jgi:hypothetical protein
MKVGDKLVCIKDYIDKDSDFDVEFKKNKIYSIVEMNENEGYDSIEIKGDVTYHNSNVIYLSHDFSVHIAFSKKSGYKYLYKYFASLKEYRKLFSLILNGAN